jgi:hypothetical protein
MKVTQRPIFMMPIFVKIEMVLQLFVKTFGTKFHQNRFKASRVETCERQADGRVLPSEFSLCASCQKKKEGGHNAVEGGGGHGAVITCFKAATIPTFATLHPQYQMAISRTSLL